MAKRPTAKDSPGREATAPPAGPALPGSGHPREWTRASAGVAVVMLVILVQTSRTHVAWPSDHFSDMHTLLAGENFARYGLVNLRFLPVHYGPALGEHRRYYTHFPPLPDVMNGLIRMAGVRSLATMRVFCGALAIVGLYLAARGMGAVIGPAAATAGLLAVGVSGFFMNFGISVHQHTYNMLLVGVFLFLLLRVEAGASHGRWLWGGCWAALFLGSLASFEWILYPQIFAWVYVLVSGSARRHWKALLLLATAPAAGVGLHFLQNAWAIGWPAAWRDFLGYGQYGGQNRLDALLELPERLQRHSQEFFYWPWFALPLMGGVSLLLLHARQVDPAALRKAVALLLGVAAAPLGWYVFMAAHIHHSHTVSQLWPLVLVTMGLTATAVVGPLLRGGGGGWARITAGLSAAVLVFAQLQSVLTNLNVMRSLPNAILAEAIGPDAFGQRNGVLFNTAAVAQAAYYLRNSASLCPRAGLPFPESLPELRRSLPEDWQLRYYVYFVGGDRKLYDFLASNCPGEIVVVTELDPPVFAVRFDISELHKPSDQRTPLDPAVRQRQLELEFPKWQIPGFQERLRAIMNRHWGD